MKSGLCAVSPDSMLRCLSGGPSPKDTRRLRCIRCRQYYDRKRMCAQGCVVDPRSNSRTSVNLFCRLVSHWIAFGPRGKGSNEDRFHRWRCCATQRIFLAGRQRRPRVGVIETSVIGEIQCNVCIIFIPIYSSLRVILGTDANLCTTFQAQFKNLT